MSLKKPNSTYLIPGKTFIFGEYSALLGGSALVFNHNPCFKVKTVDGEGTAFHPKSPVGKWMSLHNIKNDFLFSTHYTQGGFGGSTAEFLGVYALNCEFNHRLINPVTLLGEYKSLFTPPEGVPSGYDLLAQWKGGFCSIHESKIIESREWLFDDLDLCLFSTNNKLPTHDHLKNLALQNLDSLKVIAKSVMSKWLQNNQHDFLHELNNFAEELENKKLVDEKTNLLLAKIRSFPGVLACKGCGAMGADTILVIIEKKYRQELISGMEKNNLVVIADQNSIFLRELKDEMA